MLRIAVPNKGVLSEPAAEMLRRERLPPAAQHQGPRGLRPGQRHRVLLPAAAGHRRLRRRRHARRRHHRPRHAAGDRAATAGAAAVEVMPLGFGRSSFRFAAPVESGIERVGQLAGQADRHRLPGAAAALPGRVGHQGRAWSSSTARWRPPAGSASPTRSATSWRPGRRCARPGCTSSASRCCARGGAGRPTPPPTRSRRRPAVLRLAHSIAPCSGLRARWWWILRDINWTVPGRRRVLRHPRAQRFGQEHADAHPGGALCGRRRGSATCLGGHIRANEPAGAAAFDPSRAVGWAV